MMRSGCLRSNLTSKLPVTVVLLVLLSLVVGVVNALPDAVVYGRGDHPVLTGSVSLS